MGKAKTRNRGKPKGPTRKKPKEGKAAILAEFRDFKKMFHKWADQIQLDWNGKPAFTPGAEYRFILPSEMVNFVVSLVKKSHTGIDPETLGQAEPTEHTEEQTLEQTKQLREAIQSGVDEHLKTLPEPDPEPAPERDDRGVLDKRTFKGLPE